MNAMVPSELVEVVAGSRGYILDKGGGAPRAVCCVWAIRRFAGKIELAQNGKEYASDLETVSQYGVGVPGGVGFVYQANMLGIRAAMDQNGITEAEVVDPNHYSVSAEQPVALQTDFTNAFPSIHQSKILEELESNEVCCPLVRSARMLYGCTPNCYFAEAGVFIVVVPTRVLAILFPGSGTPWVAVALASGMRWKAEQLSSEAGQTAVQPAELRAPRKIV